MQGVQFSDSMYFAPRHLTTHYAQNYHHHHHHHCNHHQAIVDDNDDQDNYAEEPEIEHNNSSPYRYSPYRARPYYDYDYDEYDYDYDEDHTRDYNYSNRRYEYDVVWLWLLVKLEKLWFTYDTRRADDDDTAVTFTTENWLWFTIIMMCLTCTN